jgi:hypothetical protein
MHEGCNGSRGNDEISTATYYSFNCRSTQLVPFKYSENRVNLSATTGETPETTQGEIAVIQQSSFRSSSTMPQSSGPDNTSSPMHAQILATLNTM